MRGEVKVVFSVLDGRDRSIVADRSHASGELSARTRMVTEPSVPPIIILGGKFLASFFLFRFIPTYLWLFSDTANALASAAKWWLATILQSDLRNSLRVRRLEW